jgi:hypothetical protein
MDVWIKYICDINVLLRQAVPVAAQSLPENPQAPQYRIVMAGVQAPHPSP